VRQPPPPPSPLITCRESVVAIVGVALATVKRLAVRGLLAVFFVVFASLTLLGVR